MGGRIFTNNFVLVHPGSGKLSITQDQRPRVLSQVSAQSSHFCSMHGRMPLFPHDVFLSDVLVLS